MLDFLPQNSIKAELDVDNVLLQSTSKAVSNQSVQLVEDVQHNKEDLTVFFGIGMTINIVMITSFFIWGFKQWKKNDTKKK